MTLRTKRGFTLIEVILVALLIAFVAAIATPSFVNSMKGQRLRQARRTVVACGKYARSMAISRQQPMHVLVEVGGNRIGVEPGPAPKSAAEMVYTRDQVNAMTNGDLPALPPADAALEPVPGEDPRPPVQTRSLERVLEGVKIKSLALRDGLNGTDNGVVVVAYRANGTCPPYELALVDDDGVETTITVDFLGDASYEEE